jgi:hypothetical protein
MPTLSFSNIQNKEKFMRLTIKQTSLVHLSFVLGFVLAPILLVLSIIAPPLAHIWGCFWQAINLPWSLKDAVRERFNTVQIIRAGNEMERNNDNDQSNN